MRKLTPNHIHPGYTMIELLIIIAVSGLLISLGTSSYRKASERQALRGDVETILNTLQLAKKSASIGEKDCTGKLVGITVSFTQNSSNLTTQAICTADVGTASTTPLTTAQPTSSLSFNFRPLDGSTNLEPLGANLTIATPTGLTASFSISQAGAITYVQP